MRPAFASWRLLEGGSSTRGTVKPDIQAGRSNERGSRRRLPTRFSEACLLLPVSPGSCVRRLVESRNRKQLSQFTAGRP